MTGPAFDRGERVFVADRAAFGTVVSVSRTLGLRPLYWCRVRLDSGVHVVRRDQALEPARPRALGPRLVVDNTAAAP